jgi:DnaJ-domain-containing protein 1
MKRNKTRSRKDISFSRTRSSRESSMSRRESYSSEYEDEKDPLATFFGMETWLKKLYEKLGWMVLAKNRNYKSKISAYKAEIERYKRAIKNAFREYQDPDRVRDLKMMEEKIHILEDHVRRDF